MTFQNTGWNTLHRSSWSALPLSYEKGAKKDGRQNGHSSLARSVMRRETGLRALKTARVQKMAANKVQWLMQKTDCYKRTVHNFRILFRKRTCQHDLEAVGNKERVSYVKTRTILF